MYVGLRRKRVALAALLLLIALLSVLVVAPYASSVETHAATVQSLDDKKATVTELLAASTSASALITLIPDDVGTPIAEELADLSSCFLLVLGTLYLEKYLLPILGSLSFYLIVPLSCLVLAVCLVRKRERGTVKRAAVRFLVFGLALFFVIPTSVRVSDRIETIWQDSIQQALSAAVQDQEQIETLDEKKDLLSQLRDAAGNLVNGASEAVEWAKAVLNHFVEAVAVLIVTDCVIPVLVILLFAHVMKYLFSASAPERRAALPPEELFSFEIGRDEREREAAYSR